MDEGILISELWQTALNGGKPVSEFEEVKRWAEALLRPSDECETSELLKP